MTELAPVVDVCRPDYCISHKREVVFDEDDEPSELFEHLGNFAVYWQAVLTSAKRAITIGESRAFNTVRNNYPYINVNAQQCSRAYRNALVPLRNAALDEVNELIEDDPVLDGMEPDDIAFSGTRQQREHFGDKIGELLHTVGGIDLSDSELVNTWNQDVDLRIGEHVIKVDAMEQFAGVFVYEQGARLILAELIDEEPETVKRMFNPDNIRTIPEDLQLIAAYDIARGPKSLLLRFFAQDGGEQGTNTLLDYVNRNSHSPDAVRSLTEAAVVAQAAAGIVCPQNQYGLCEKLLERIDPSKLSAVNSDMAKKFAQRRDQDRRVLEALSVPLVPGWFNPTKKMSLYRGRATQGQSSKRSRRPGSPTNQATADAPAITIDKYDVQVVSQGRIYVSGLEEPLILDFREEGADVAVVDKVIASKGFRDYIAKHSHDKRLEEFLRSALMAIFRTNYSQEHAIKRMLNLNPLRIDDNTILPMYRLAGNAPFTGKVSAGDTASRTRIYFGQKCRGDERIIQVLPPKHKTEIEKSSARGTSL
ncbi:MAG TPA: hypothetical protein PL051_02675 [Candidatus Saccharibacteria bacterium]|nr:hypothetical protein [Candidatus Saccharibacteria bacterium]